MRYFCKKKSLSVSAHCKVAYRVYAKVCECDGDAAFCQITLDTCFTYDLSSANIHSLRL